VKQVKPTLFPGNPVLSDAKVLGSAVRAARTGAGMTLAEAALSIGVAKQTLSNLEAGKPGVSLGLTLKIVQALGLGLVVLERHQQERVCQTIAALPAGLPK
jgi:DNA-binding XRE family transcriptional regulator